MCGICGIVNINPSFPSTLSRKERVVKMNQAIIHRGPDGEGGFHNEVASLAMRRLAIIDKHSGNQPLWNEHKDILVFMNGEIYNFMDIRESLLVNGHKFVSRSDTEVLVHAYEEYGDGFVKKLKGMFSFCLFDLKRNRILIGRDRFGEKPLYYYHENGEFSFSSEIASLLENPLITKKLNKEALKYYLAVAYVPEPLTLLKEVHSLPPGHTLTIENNQIKINPYFEISYGNREKLIYNEKEATEYLFPVLEKAVNRQTVSDVPIGAFLSGGIDSSTVCALLQKNSPKPINTFTVKFEEASYDESKIAQEVAERIGSKHHEITIPNQNFDENLFWTIIDHVGLPFPDSSAIPVYLISKEIKKYVSVALSGDGGDEIFGGYPVFGWWKKINKLNRYPVSIRKMGLSVLNSLGTIIPQDKRRQINRAVTASLKGENHISMEIHRLFLEKEANDLFIDSPKTNFSLLTSFPKEYKNWSPLRKSMFYRIKHNLVNDMLIKVDRMSMANSLEVRAPFLDPDLFNASLNIHDDLLYKNGLGKIILRKMMSKHLPKSVFNHPKSGFSIPLHKYQNDNYRRLSENLLNKNNPLFNTLDYQKAKQIEAVTLSNKTLVNATKYRSSHQHWALLLLAGWMKKYQVEN